MIEKLFSSKARVEVLKLFVFHPGESFYQRQIAQLTRQPIRAVQRELEKLSNIDFIEAAQQGNRVYYKVNKECPIFPDVKNIILKCVGIADSLKSVLQRKPAVQVAFIYGSYAKGSEKLGSDIDILVVGDITLRELSGLLSGVKRDLGREINFAVFPPREFARRILRKDRFISGLLKEKKIFIAGDSYELKKIASAGQAKGASDIKAGNR